VRVRAPTESSDVMGTPRTIVMQAAVIGIVVHAIRKQSTVEADLVDEVSKLRGEIRTLHGVW
jgi:hypothetical protein